MIPGSIAEQPEPRERMVQVVKWYLSAFHAGRKGSVAKKPYNPILGEVFYCHWDLPSDVEESAPVPVRLWSLTMCHVWCCLELWQSLSDLHLSHSSTRRRYQMVQFLGPQPTVCALWQSRSLTTHPVGVTFSPLLTRGIKKAKYFVPFVSEIVRLSRYKRSFFFLFACKFAQ